MFACASLFLWHIYGQVHWATQTRIAGRIKEQLAFADSELVLAYFMMVGLAIIWCIWSWLSESRFSAIIATLFTFIAVALVTTMSTHITP